ncbi:hypothetical protein [Thiocystis violacea]|uniref:hypothetical protein n=1 Tax=Thiocystis violacea TaxID=13725 RepID=UPI0019071F1B|nr:hypothetical protein [Thiocystis violacea]MBK1716674.1 hypothetical protein [Thiocystis violacea]
MTPEQTRIAAAFGNTPETLRRYGRAPHKIAYNSDAARIAAAFGHVLPGNDIRHLATAIQPRTQANAQTQTRAGGIAFAADQPLRLKTRA